VDQEAAADLIPAMKTAVAAVVAVNQFLPSVFQFYILFI
jgi:hypothetical protein